VCVCVCVCVCVVYSLVCGSGIPFVGCDCVTAEVVDSCTHLVGILFPHINDDARSKSHQTLYILHKQNAKFLNVTAGGTHSSHSTSER